jgi:molybdate transport system substrate-binding protein
MQDLIGPAAMALAMLSTQAPRGGGVDAARADATEAPRGEAITLSAPGGIRTALQRLIPLFEEKTGRKVAAAFMSGGAAKAKIAAGEAIDVAVVQPPCESVIASGNVRRDSETPLANVSVVAAVAAGAARPEIGTSEGLKQALLGARSIASPSAARGAACGVSFEATLAALGIAEVVMPKVTMAPSGWEAVKMLARGEVELAITFASENDPDPRVQMLGPLARDVSTPTGFVAFLNTRAKDAEGAAALIRFLASPEAARVYRDCGMVPGK